METKMNPTKEPDIAFWFDEEDYTKYLVRIRGRLMHVQLLQACFDLLMKAIKTDSQTLLGETVEDEEE